jgi:predicted PurR-regulated permease PerM
MQTRERIRLGVLEAAHSLSRYLVSWLITNTLLGLAVWGAFAWAGVHYAGVWGVIAALLHFVPYLGPLVTVLATAVYAAFQFHSVLHGLLIGGVVMLLSALICVLLQTWLTARSVRMNWVAVFVAVLLFSSLWGVLGLIIAVPLMIILRAICRQLPRMQWFDTLVGDREGDSTARRDGAAAPGFALPGTSRDKR